MVQNSISTDLMMAILSMDAYNRGPNRGIISLLDGVGTKVGDATIISLTLPAGAADASFHAVSYDVSGDGAGLPEPEKQRATSERI